MSARKATAKKTPVRRLTKTKVNSTHSATKTNGSPLKSLLKTFRLNESSISMILGAIVIIAVGLLVVNYYRNLKPAGSVTPGAQTEDITKLPTNHKVAKGDTLWSISVKYYGTGYNWIDIQKANNLPNANAISEGQDITIPSVEGEEVELAEATPEASPVTPKATETPLPTVTTTPTISPTATPEATSQPEVISPSNNEIAGETYTVVKGDTLWNIAVRAYGDGYKWVEIARANSLVNPNLIHSGNVFSLPR